MLPLLIEHLLISDPWHKDGESPLHWACNKGHAAVVEKLMQHDADVEAKTSVRLRLEQLPILVVQAASCNYDASSPVHTLSPYFMTQNGHTPLHWACNSGHVAVVEKLIENGADLEANDQVRSNGEDVPRAISRRG